MTITGCLENCCHAETQDVGLVPSYRELDGQQVNGFNVLVGGKQGSGGYLPRSRSMCSSRRPTRRNVCQHIVAVFRDHGSRGLRIRARLAFLLQERGVPLVPRRVGTPLGQAVAQGRPGDAQEHHVDHLGIHPQKRRAGYEGPPLYYAGLLVPVGRITTAQMRGVADLAECYGNGDIRLTVQQNLLIPNVPETKPGALTEEPLLKELPFDPSPILRGLVTCVGSDYCHFALIETKGWGLKVAQELDRARPARRSRH